MHLCRSGAAPWRRRRRPLQSHHDSSPHCLHLTPQLLLSKYLQDDMIPLRANKAEFQPLLYGSGPGWRASTNQSGAARFDGGRQQRSLCPKSRRRRAEPGGSICPSITEPFQSLLCGVYDGIKKTLLTRAFSQSGRTTNSRSQIFLNGVSTEREPVPLITPTLAN